MRELAVALQEQDLGEDGDGDFARRLVAQLESDGRVQPLILTRVAANPLGDAPEDDSHFAPAADESDVARVGAQRGFENTFVESVAAGEDDHEVARAGREAAKRILGKIDAAHFRCFWKPRAVGKLRT